jgi:hypothetical protein
MWCNHGVYSKGDLNWKEKVEIGRNKKESVSNRRTREPSLGSDRADARGGTIKKSEKDVDGHYSPQPRQRREHEVNRKGVREVGDSQVDRIISEDTSNRKSSDLRWQIS